MRCLLSTSSKSRSEWVFGSPVSCTCQLWFSTCSHLRGKEDGPCLFSPPDTSRLVRSSGTVSAVFSPGGARRKYRRGPKDCGYREQTPRDNLRAHWGRSLRVFLNGSGVLQQTTGAEKTRSAHGERSSNRSGRLNRSGPGQGLGIPGVFGVLLLVPAPYSLPALSVTPEFRGGSWSWNFVALVRGFA